MNLIKNLKLKIKNFLLDTLFPISCLTCGKNDTWLCPECFSKIKLLSAQICPYCEKNTTDKGKICSVCREKFLEKTVTIPLDSLIVTSSYKENNIASLVHLFKYNFVQDLSFPLGKLSIKALLQNNAPLPDLIIPIPLHPRRLRWRGFNQSELLASYISENITPGFSIPVFFDLVKRNRYTKPQMKVKSYQERQKNISNIFEINIRSDISGKNILLVDDIATTGATLFECGKVLKQNGAKSVQGLVIARQEM